MSTNSFKEHSCFFILRFREVIYCRNKKKEKDRSRSRSRRRSRSRSRSRSGSRDKKKKKRKDRSRSRSGGGDNKRKERDEAEKEAGEVHSDGERKKVREQAFLFGLEDGFTLISRMLKIWPPFCSNYFLSGGLNLYRVLRRADQNYCKLDYYDFVYFWYSL
jgi:hypothetical protein